MAGAGALVKQFPWQIDLLVVVNDLFQVHKNEGFIQVSQSINGLFKVWNNQVMASGNKSTASFRCRPELTVCS